MTAVSRLSEAHWQQLVEGSAIAPDIISERGYLTVESKHQWQQLDQKLGDRQIRTPGLGFPVYRLGTPEPYAMVLRPDNPRTNAQGTPVKYEWPKAITPCLDILPHYRDGLKDPGIDIWITEGAKKADSLASHFGDTIVPISLNGVWGWRGRNELGGKLVLPDIDEIALNGRRIVLAFDSDVVRKKQVLQALQRLAHVLSSRDVREIQVLVLPQEGDNKLGVDDAFAQGWTRDRIEGHLMPLGQASTMGRERLFKHPVTGEELFVPSGYIVNGKTIARMGKNGEPYNIYPGLIAVTSTGVDLDSNTETLTITFEGRHGKTEVVRAPRETIARSRGAVEKLAPRGAAIHDANAKEMARFLIEFAYENRDALPHVAHTSRLGLIGEGLITPAGSVGFKDPIEHYRDRRIHVGEDREAYKRAFASALGWQQSQAFWFPIAASLASPAIAKLNTRRNATAYTAGGSGTGKSTVNMAAVGLFGDPTREPFKSEGIRSTQVGLLQTLEELNGLAHLIDEAHVGDPKKLEALVYQFANKQTYTKGSLEGKAAGGVPLLGVLLLAGEAAVEFRYAGAHRRIMWIDANLWRPLGEGTVGLPGTEENALGAQRAALLEQAWEEGAGQLGLAVCKRIWDHWPDFVRQVDRYKGYEQLADLQAWRPLLAIMLAALDVLLVELDLERTEEIQQLPAAWQTMFLSGQELADPATEAWEQVMVMLAQSNTEEKGGSWEVLRLGQDIIAGRPVGDKEWRVLTGSPQFKNRVGVSAVQQHGRTWLQRHWIQECRGGATSMHAKIGPGGGGQCILISEEAIASWTD